MSRTFEEKKRLSQGLFEDAKGATNETTPNSLTAVIERFAAELGGKAEFVPVRGDDQYGLFGWCSDGVLEKIKHNGGGIRYGWTIWEWPEIFLTAEFHAVWISQTGELVDITPKPQYETRIVFVPDAAYEADFDFDKRPTNRRFRIPQEPDYGQLADAEIAAMKPSQLRYESARAAKKGMKLRDWIASKQTRPTFPGIVDELIAVCDAFERKREQLSGNSNYFIPDRKYDELQRKKVNFLQAAQLAAAKVKASA